MKYAVLAALPFAVFANGAWAQDYNAALTSFLESGIRGWAGDSALIAAVAASNAAHQGIDQAGIDALDGAWKAEVGASDAPTISPVLSNPAADFLRAQMDASGGKIVEAFITDAQGLNVAVTAPTSDMWQGDEAKFTEVFPNGAGAVHLGEVELDESTQSYQAQISVPVVDPATQAVIGTLTVGVNADALL